MAVIVGIEGLVKDFGGHRAVDGLSLEIEEGEIFGLLGPNGAGKTTTIRVLTTLLRPTQGRAVVCGFDVAQAPDEVRRRIGYVMQEVALERMLTGRQNLELQANLYHLSRSEIGQRIAELLELVELAPWADKDVDEYSGGMRKRLDLACGLLHRPSLLILDEPSLGLDVQTRHRIWDYIEALREQGTTILLATNYLDEADRLCDRLAIIDGGRKIVEGDPTALKASVGADVVTLQVRGDASALVAALTKDAAVKQTLDTPAGIRVYVQDAATMLPALIRLADASSVVLEGATYKQPSLDDVFLLHTGRQIREE